MDEIKRTSFCLLEKRNPLSEDLPVRPVVRHQRHKGSGRQAALSGTGSHPAAFPQGFQINYWLTDFKVRSERMARFVDSLVKDDDAVAELAMSRCGANWSRVRIQAAGIGPVRGIVRNICGEKFLHFVIYVLKSKSCSPQFQLALQSCADLSAPFHSRICFGMASVPSPAMGMTTN